MGQQRPMGGREPTHEPGTDAGESKIRTEGKEPGRKDTGTTGAGRPAGKASSRNSTGINPKEPIDPQMPYLQAP